MRLYFFDVTHGAEFYRDECGDTFQCHEEARRQAVRLLPDLARDHLILDDWREVGVEVRDEAGATVYRATLTLHEDWDGVGDLR